MAVVHLIPESGETRTSETHPIAVRITPTVERDYLRRGVFPHLRTCSAARMAGATAVFFITAAEAAAILDDASAQRMCRDAPRGTLKAYKSLTESLVNHLDRERNRGLIPDPGYEVAKARDAEGWHPLRESDVAVCWSERGNAECDGETLLITRGYHYGLFDYEAGRYLACDGTRVNYQWGYSAKFLTGNREGEEYFFPAYQLRSPRSEITHVRLVSEFAHQRGAK